MSFPSPLGTPVRVSPKGASYDAAAKRLSWTMTAASMMLPGGGPHALAAAFVLPGDTDMAALAAAAADRLVAEVTLTGAPGGCIVWTIDRGLILLFSTHPTACAGSTLSGVVLNQSSKSSEPSAYEWKACVTARPERPVILTA